MTSRLLIAAAFGAVALLTTGPALAIEDPVLNTAINEQKIGETADGYLAAVDGAAVPADARARMDQLNLRRRATYTERAQTNSVSVEEYARSFGCTLLVKNTPVGASYRDQGGSWRRNTGTVTLPSYCPPVKTAALIAALGAILIGAAIAIVLAWQSAQVEISIFGWVVIGIGAVLAIALGGGLMALSFYSARRGYDDRLNEQDPER